jgi:hypothetical protein
MKSTFSNQTKLRDSNIATSLAVIPQRTYVLPYFVLLFYFFISDSFAQIHVGRIADGDGGASLNGTRSVFVSGNYAYVGTSSGLEIVDVTNPTVPTHKGKIETGGAGPVFVAGSYAYITNGTLQIIDVSNRTAPMLKYNLGLSGAMAVYVSGVYAYVVAGDYSGNGFLQIVDVSNPALPVLVGSIGGSPFTTAASIYVSGNYAYITTLNNPNFQFQIVDISNPTAPVLKGNMNFHATVSNPDGSTVTNNEPFSVFVLGRYAYLGMVSGVEIVDVIDPATPVRKGRWADASSSAMSVKVIGNNIYSSDHLLNTLDVIDASNLSAPKLRARLHIDQVPNNGYLNSISISGNYAYMTNNANSLEVISISPLAPLAPVASTISTATPTSFLATWNPLEDATAYSVDVSATPDFSTLVSPYDNLSVNADTSLNVTGLESGAKYYSRIRATGPGGISLNSNVISMTLSAPAAPIVNDAISVTDNSFTANWGASTGATGYFLDVSKFNNFSSYESSYNNVSVGNVTSATITGLTAGTLYYYRVRAANAVGLSGSSNIISVALSSPPLPNVYLTSPADGANGLTQVVTVTSKVLTGATTYTIELNTASDFTGVALVKNGTSRVQVFSGLSYGTTYHTRVKTDLSPYYGKSTSFTIRPAEQFTYVSTPINLATSQNITLNVASTLVTGASTYTIELNTVSDFTGVSFVKTGANRVQAFTGLSFGTTYYTRVKTDLSPNYGKSTSFTTGPAELFTYVLAPGNLVTGQNVTLNVASTQVTGATIYTIELNTAPDFTGVSFEKTGTNRIQAFTGLSFGTTYYTRVKTDLSPNYGKSTSFTTGSTEQFTYVLAPGNLATGQNVTLNVASTLVTGATTYTIELNTASDFTGVSFEKTGTNRIQAFSGLSFGTTYYTRVKTDLSPIYGKSTQFTTSSASALSYITSPANNSVNVAYVTNVTSNSVANATTYTIELNSDPNFGVSTAIVKSGGKTIAFQLSYNTKYYARVLTDLNQGAWGATRSFTTGSPLTLAYVASPLNGATGVPSTVDVVSYPVPGATSYTIELNTAPDFSGINVTKTGTTRRVNFSGLMIGTTYYTRVQTNAMPGQWGTTSTSFSLTSTPGGRIEGWSGDDIKEQTLEFGPIEVSIYPIPFRETLRVHYQSDTQTPLLIQMLDTTGKTILSHHGETNNLIELETRQLPAGFYIIKIVGSKGLCVRKILKED